MKIGCLCITWNAPACLGRLVECFNRQTHQDRELLILDDAGQLQSQSSGDRWQVVSFKRRFRTIGEKRAACVGLMSPDVDAIAVWDQDDVFLPWALSSCAQALQRAPWAQARIILEWDNDGAGPGWHKQETFSRKDPFRPGYHSSWSFRREAYCAVGGYAPSAHEDWPLAEALLRKFGPSADSTADGRPWMAYSRGPTHLSTRIRHHADSGAGGACFTRAWEERAGDVIEPVDDLRSLVKWERPYDRLEIPEEVHRRPW